MSFRMCAWRVCAIALVCLLVGCGGGSTAATGAASGNSGGSGGAGGSGGTGGSGSTTPPAVTGIATPKAVSVVTAN